MLFASTSKTSYLDLHVWQVINFFEGVIYDRHNKSSV